MAQASIDKCLMATGGSRFDLVKKAARRAHDLASGSMSQLPQEARVHKSTVVALMEIALSAEQEPQADSEQNY